MKSAFRIVIFWVFLLPVQASDISVQPVVIPGNIEYIVENGAPLVFGDVLAYKKSSWSEAEVLPVNFGNPEHGVWLKLIFRNVEKVSSERLLHLGNPHLKKVDIYVIYPDERVIRMEYGADRPFHDRPVFHREVVVPVVIGPEESLTLLIRAESAAGMQLPLRLLKPEVFWQEAGTHQLLFGLYFGAMLVFVLFNGLLYVYRNEALHLFLALNLAAFSLLHANLLGLNFQYLWPTDPEFNQNANYIFVYLTIIAASVFATHFLSAWQSKMLMGIHYGICILATVGIVFLLSIGYRLSFYPAVILSVVTSVWLLFICLYQWRQGVQKVLVFGVAYALAGGSIILFAGQKLGWLPVSHITEYGMVYSMLIQGGMFTLAIITWNGEAGKESADQSHQALPDSVRSWMAQFSHEIRTPLNGVIGMADLLKETPLNPTQFNYVRVLSSSGEHLVNLVSDILDYESLSTGNIKLDKIPFSLSTLFSESIQLFQQQAKENAVQLTTNIKPDVPSDFTGDPKRLRQIIINLLSNAVKFTHEGTVCLSAEYENGELIIIVEDDGIGMTPLQQQTIFERFRQADASVYRQYGGSGLGLAICRQLAQLMGGDIRVESEVESFCRFTVNVPLESHIQATSYSEMSASMAFEQDSVPVFAENGNGYHRTLNILGVDDNEINLRVLNAMLTKLGHNVYEAASGKEAIDIVCSGKDLDLILMDCEMPYMDGFETTRRIRKWQYGQPGTPCSIIALTAHTMDEHKQKCLSSGMDGHLCKPIHLDELKELTDQLTRIGE